MREMNLSKNQTHRHRGPTCGSQGGGCWRWVDWEFGVSIRKQLHIEWINTIVLLLSTESYIQCPIWTMMEKNLLKNINSLLSVTRSWETQLAPHILGGKLASHAIPLTCGVVEWSSGRHPSHLDLHPLPSTLVWYLFSRSFISAGSRGNADMLTGNGNATENLRS